MGMNPFSKMYIPKRTVVSASDVFVPGFYIKTHNLQPHYGALDDMETETGIIMNGSRSRTRGQWTGTHLVEIQLTPHFKGYQLSVPWGLYERGASGGDFSRLTTHLLPLVQELATLGKYVVLMPMIFRDFRNNDVTGNASTDPMAVDDQMRFLLPADLATDFLGLADGLAAGDAHRLSNHCYAYVKSRTAGAFGFEMKLYNTEVYNRYLAFQQAVANVFKDEPNVIGVTTTESIAGEALYPGTAPGGVVNDLYTPTSVRLAVLNAKTTFINAVRDMWPRQWCAPDVNGPLRAAAVTNYVKTWYDQVVAQKFGVSASDYGWWTDDLNDDGSTGIPTEIGHLRRQAALAGQVVIYGQWQGDGWLFGEDGAPAWSASSGFTQRYNDMLTRCTVGSGEPMYAVPCNMIVIQREVPQNIWLGGTTSGVYGNVPSGTTVPSLRSFIVNLPTMPLITTEPTIINNL